MNKIIFVCVLYGFFWIPHLAVGSEEPIVLATVERSATTGPFTMPDAAELSLVDRKFISREYRSDMHELKITELKVEKSEIRIYCALHYMKTHDLVFNIYYSFRGKKQGLSFVQALKTHVECSKDEEVYFMLKGHIEFVPNFKLCCSMKRDDLAKILKLERSVNVDQSAHIEQPVSKFFPYLFPAVFCAGMIGLLVFYLKRAHYFQ
jgi:hypothetical protein